MAVKGRKIPSSSAMKLWIDTAFGSGPVAMAPGWRRAAHRRPTPVRVLLKGEGGHGPRDDAVTFGVRWAVNRDLEGGGADRIELSTR
jgi:hypothetical protein